MSFEQFKRAVASLGSDFSSLTPELRLLVDVVERSTSEAQAIKGIESVFSKLAPDEQAALVEAAFADPDPIVETLRRLAGQAPEHGVTNIRPEQLQTHGQSSDAQTIEDAMTEVWVLITETRFLFGHPADSWRVPDPMQYLDVFPREHERWGVRHPVRRELAVLVDGTPCDVVAAGLRRMKRAAKLLDGVRQLTTADRVPVRDEFMNVGGGIGGVKAPTRTDCSIATTAQVVAQERRRLDTLLQQGGELFHAAQKEYERQRVKRIAFLRDFRLARQMAERAVERGTWEAKPLLEWMQQ